MGLPPQGRRRVLGDEVSHTLRAGYATAGQVPDAHLVIIARMVEGRIRVGDAVTLKSGGPVMTVRALSQSLAYCAWPGTEDRVHYGTFDVDSLALVEQPDRKAHGRDSAWPDAG